VVEYARLLEGATPPSGQLDMAALTKSLEDAWLTEYEEMCRHELNVLQFVDGGFTFLFDQTSGNGSACEDRLVAAHGLSVVATAGRDRSRIQGFLGGGLDIPGKGRFDKGHVLAHAMGGGLDVNLFPQRAALNRGRSSEGKVYRRMEAYAAGHPGTFVFSRLLYADATWVPSALEYGILLSKDGFWVESFTN
jgi:hypothetical protein